MYLCDVLAVAQQELVRVRVFAVDRLTDVDDVHSVVVPQQVVLTQVAVNEHAVAVHLLHRLQNESTEYKHCNIRYI